MIAVKRRNYLCIDSASGTSKRSMRFVSMAKYGSSSYQDCFSGIHWRILGALGFRQRTGSRIAGREKSIARPRTQGEGDGA